MKVFIVDDSAIIVEKLTAMLSDIQGVKCIGNARDVAGAIRSIIELKPDVVILDIRLGGGNGMDVLVRIKKETPPPIIIMLTNYPYPQYREKCQALGANFFFDKVTDIGKINHLIKELAMNKPDDMKKNQKKTDVESNHQKTQGRK